MTPSVYPKMLLAFKTLFEKRVDYNGLQKMFNLIIAVGAGDVVDIGGVFIQIG